MGDERRERLPREGDRRRDEHGQDGGRRIREGPRRPQIPRRKITRRRSVIARHGPIVEPAESELGITRVFDAPRALVFKVWTDPRHAKNWWGPRDCPATHLEMDVRPGGAWRGRLRATNDGKELGLGGVFREVVAP